MRVPGQEAPAFQRLDCQNGTLSKVMPNELKPCHPAEASRHVIQEGPAPD